MTNYIKKKNVTIYLIIKKVVPIKREVKDNKNKMHRGYERSERWKDN